MSGYRMQLLERALQEKEDSISTLEESVREKEEKLHQLEPLSGQLEEMTRRWSVGQQELEAEKARVMRLEEQLQVAREEFSRERAAGVEQERTLNDEMRKQREQYMAEMSEGAQRERALEGQIIEIRKTAEIQQAKCVEYEERVAVLSVQVAQCKVREELAQDQLQEKAHVWKEQEQEHASAMARLQEARHSAEVKVAAMQVEVRTGNPCLL